MVLLIEITLVLQSQNNWSERNGGEPGDYLATSPRKEFSTRGFTDTNWRRHRNGEDDEGWRASRADKWGECIFLST